MAMTLKTSIEGDELLTKEQMYTVDAAAIKNGISAGTLMENAGRAVVVEITKRFKCQPITVFCGTGNNGGDGFVIARLLKERGWPTRLILLGELDSLSDDASEKSKYWSGEVEHFNVDCFENSKLVIDAMFGVGLKRAIGGDAAIIIEEINKRKLNCVAVDIPSGVDSNTGEVLGVAPRCDLTVTFYRKKPGHLLNPGRDLSGEISIADIGVDTAFLKTIKTTIFENSPKHWLKELPHPVSDDHKFKRGSTLIVGGSPMTGASRLAAKSAARIGSGLVTITVPSEALPLYASDDPSFIIKPYKNFNEIFDLFEDERFTSILIGPGCGLNQITKDVVQKALGQEKPVVLDADALTVFKDCRADLIGAEKACALILTPHEGEFSRLFKYKGDKLQRCRTAAEESDAVILLKGYDTVIANPNAETIINNNAPANLATAGAGDVLSGIIAGLLAQGMDPFLSAASAAWLHGKAAAGFGMGLIASDIPELIPNVLIELYEGT